MTKIHVGDALAGLYVDFLQEVTGSTEEMGDILRIVSQYEKRWHEIADQHDLERRLFWELIQARMPNLPVFLGRH